MAEAPTLFYTNIYNSRVGKIAILTIDNGEDYKKPTTFSEKALESLHSAMDRVEAEKGLKGMMLCGKHYIFAAGADLMQIPFINTFEQGRQSGAAGHAAMKRIMDLKIPTLAAINGAALGGGLEDSALLQIPDCLQGSHRHRIPGVFSRPGAGLGRVHAYDEADRS